MSTPARFVTLTTAAVTTPAPADGSPARTHLLGLAMFIAERDAQCRWSFILHADVVEMGMPEAALLEWAADHIPHPATLIGWRIANEVLSPLLNAVTQAEETVALHFTARLARLTTGLTIDMAEQHGGDALPFDAVALRAGISIPVLDEDDRFNCWAFGTLDRVRFRLGEEAIALWRFWLTLAGERGSGADLATAAWLAERG